MWGREFGSFFDTRFEAEADLKKQREEIKGTIPALIPPELVYVERHGGEIIRYWPVDAAGNPGTAVRV